MKRLFPVLVCCLARVAPAQMTTVPTTQATETPVYVTQNVEVRGDGRCMTVRPGDTVHYTLTIENLGDTRSVFGELRLRYGRSRESMRGDLPLPDFRSLGGGGVGLRDAGSANMFHFQFKVPQDIYGGTYRGVEVSVSADRPVQTPVYRPVGLRAPKVDVTRHTRDEVHAYCLNVASNFGVREKGPAVTNFEPGAIDPPPAAPAPPQPLPLPKLP